MRDSDHSSDSEAATIPRETHNTEQVYESEYKTARFDNIYQVRDCRFPLCIELYYYFGVS